MVAPLNLVSPVIPNLASIASERWGSSVKPVRSMPKPFDSRHWNSAV